MDRREILKRRLRADITWGLGNVSCHEIDASSGSVNPVSAEPTSDEDYYVITVDSNTGDTSVAPGVIE